MTEPSAVPRESRRGLLLAWAGVALVVSVLALASTRSWRDLQRAREREADLAVKIQETEARITALKGRIDRLRDDPLLLERLAREELGLARPGEVVIHLPPTP